MLDQRDGELQIDLKLKVESNAEHSARKPEQHQVIRDDGGIRVRLDCDLVVA